MILPVSEISKIEFMYVLEDSADTLRKSCDGTKTFIKWEGEAPSFISDIDGGEGFYTHEEMVNILNTEEWTEFDL
jgi:hypothetical protein